MLAFLGNIGPLEMVVIVVVAVLIFGKNLPQAASKAYLELRKLRGSIDDLRRESGIDRELRNIERTVREADWEARRPAEPKPMGALPGPSGPARTPPPPASPGPEVTAPEPQGPGAPAEPPRPTDAAG